MFKASKDQEGALIDLRLFRGSVFSASAVTQFSANGLAFAGQMLIPIYLIRAAGESPSTDGWFMAPLGLGMMCAYPWMGQLTKRFGIRGTSAGGATVALLGTLPFLYLSSRHLDVAVLEGTLFIRGVGLSAVGVPSISAAYASVPREQLPMATTSLNIVQRLGGPTLTTLCATFLGWQLAANSPANVTGAFTIGFALLCGLHAVLIVATMRLPLRLEKIEVPRERS